MQRLGRHLRLTGWRRWFSRPCLIMSSLIVSTLMLTQPTLAGPIVSDDALRQKGSSAFFTTQPISDKVFKRINGRSWKAACGHNRQDFRYLRVLHHDGHGHIRHGELIVHKSVAADLIEIFEALYIQGYPIERMVLIDDYGADDERSMMANNSSVFNCRVVKGSRKLSPHARGIAIDLNPLYNPYVKTKNGHTIVQPEGGRVWIKRGPHVPYGIEEGDLMLQLFKERGWIWGGDWKSLKDYQHFEKRLKP